MSLRSADSYVQGMLLVLILTFRDVYAGTPHAVYGVPPVQTNFGFSQPQRSPLYSTVKQWGPNFYVHQVHQPSGRHEYNTLTSYWGGTPNYRTAPVVDHSLTLITPASTQYRPLEGLPALGQTYNTHPGVSTDPYSHRNNHDYYRPPDSSNRYDDFFRRYYAWYYQNAYREPSNAEHNPPKGPYPPGVPENHEPQGAYTGPAAPSVGSSGQPLQSPSNAGPPWWLNGGFTGPPAVASSSSGGPVGPFTKPRIPQKSLPKKAPLARKEPGLAEITNRINDDSTYEASKNDKEGSSGDKSAMKSKDLVDTTTSSTGNSESGSEETSSSDSVTTPETPSSEESPSTSSEQESSSSSPSTETPSSDENPSSPSDEATLPTSESTSSSSADVGSSSSPEVTSSSSEESTSPSSSSSEEASSPSTEESSSSESDEGVSSSSEETSSPSSEDGTAPSSEDSLSTSEEISSPASTTTEASESAETNTIKSAS